MQGSARFKNRRENRLRACLVTDNMVAPINTQRSACVMSEKLSSLVP